MTSVGFVEPKPRLLLSGDEWRYDMFDRQMPQPSDASERGGDPALMLATLRSSGDEMTMSEVRTLVSLATDGPQTVSSVAARLHLNESTVEALCSVLVARGFVVRIPTVRDTGASIVALSIGGRRRVDDAICHQGLVLDSSPPRLASIGTRGLVATRDCD